MNPQKLAMGDFDVPTDVVLRLMSLGQDWIGILNQQRQIQWVNAAWSNGLGLAAAEIIGRTFDDLIHTTELNTIAPLFQQANPQPFEFNACLRDARGEPINVLWRLFTDADCYYLSGQRLPTSTTKNHDPIHITFEQAPIGIVHLDLEGRWLRVNRKFCEFLGYTEAEMMQLTFRDITLPDDFPLYSEMMVRLITGVSNYEETDRVHLHKNGSPIWMHLTGTLVRDENGEPSYFIVTLENSQTRKETEEALYQSQVRYRMVADYTYDWEFWQRPDGTFEYMSPSVERITGYSPAEFIADPTLLEKIILPDDRPSYAMHLQQETAGLPERILQFRVRHKTGGIRWIEHMCVPIFEDGRYLGRRASNRDITERKETQAELEDERHLLTGIFRAAPDYIYLMDLDLRRQVLSNRIMVGNLEMSSQPITLDQALAIMHPDDAAAWTAYYMEQDRPPDEAPHDYEFRISDGADGWRWIRTREVVFRRRADGSVHQILGISHDITAEKEYDQALRESELRFRQMFERHQAVKLLIDPTTGNIVDANPAAAKFYGWDVATLRTMRIQQINTLPDEQVRAEMARAATEQRDFFHFKHRTASSEIREVEVHSAPVEISGKTLLYSIVTDVTNLHEAQRAQRVSESRFDAFMKNSPMAAYIKDFEGRLLYINPVCASVFGLEHVAWQNQTKIPLWGNDASIRDTDKRTLALGMTTITEETVVIAGEARVWLTHTFPIQDEEGQLFVGGMGVDITDMKRAERQLVEMALERERMQILGHFIEKVSHEFRTPLSVIEIGVDALRRLTDEAKRARHLNAMEEQVFHIVRLVESMVTTTQLDSMAHVNAEPVSIQSLMRGVAETFTQTYPERAPQFHLVTTDTPLMVSGDANLLRRAIGELLTNAQRFTPADGQIVLEVRPLDQQVAIMVRDSGMGITLDDQRRIFERFFRVDSAHTTRGVGLGLSIAKRIVELHHGAIEVESTLGVGSVFRLTLPCAE